MALIPEEKEALHEKLGAGVRTRYTCESCCSRPADLEYRLGDAIMICKICALQFAGNITRDLAELFENEEDTVRLRGQLPNG